MVKPLAVLDPVSAMSSRFQYSDDTCLGRYRPVTTNRTYCPDIRSFIRSVSPSVTCSSAAAEAGSAAGMAPCGWPLAGAPGQRPEISAACAAMPPSTAASAIGWLPALGGWAGREPGTNPSGSDQ